MGLDDELSEKAINLRMKTKKFMAENYDRINEHYESTEMPHFIT